MDLQDHLVGSGGAPYGARHFWLLLVAVAVLGAIWSPVSAKSRNPTCPVVPCSSLNQRSAPPSGPTTSSEPEGAGIPLRRAGHVPAYGREGNARAPTPSASLGQQEFRNPPGDRQLTPATRLRDKLSTSSPVNHRAPAGAKPAPAEPDDAVTKLPILRDILGPHGEVNVPGTHTVYWTTAPLPSPPSIVASEAASCEYTFDVFPGWNAIAPPIVTTMTLGSLGDLLGLSDNSPIITTNNGLFEVRLLKHAREHVMSCGSAALMRVPRRKKVTVLGWNWSDTARAVGGPTLVGLSSPTTAFRLGLSSPTLNGIYFVAPEPNLRFLPWLPGYSFAQRTLFKETGFLVTAGSLTPPPMPNCNSKAAKEPTGTLRGRLEEVAIDRRDGCYRQHYLAAGGVKTAVSFEGRPAPALGAELEVSVENGKVARCETLSPPRRGKEFNLGPQPTLVIMANIDGRPCPATTSALSDLFFGDHMDTVADFYRRNSFGLTTIVGDVVGPYELHGAITFDDVERQAIQQADNDVDFRQYKRIVVVSPHVECWPLAGGLSYIGTTFAYTQEGAVETAFAEVFNPDLMTAAHEMGHGFGVGHSSSLACYDDSSARVPFSTNCTSIEYGDAYTIMSSQPVKHFSAVMKESIGWIRNSVVTTSGTYYLNAVEMETAGLQLIKIPVQVKPCVFDGWETVYYTLDSRKPVDYDAPGGDNFWNSAYNGTTIRFAAADPSRNTYFTYANLTPGQISASLQVGKSYYDAANQVRIAVVAANADGVTVTIGR